jgi:hypothetical protein
MKGLINLIDTDKNGTIDFQEFLKLIELGVPK